MNIDGGFLCNCDCGWFGGICDININECLNNVCKNGGICWDFVGSYECLC